MKYIQTKGRSLHYQRDFPRRLQHITGKGFYRRLQLTTEAPLQSIIQTKQTLDFEFEHLVELAERHDTNPELIKQLSNKKNEQQTLNDVWQQYADDKHLSGKSRQAADNDWARFIRASGNFECNNSNQTAQLINKALQNHAKQRLAQVKPSTIKRELSLIVAALNHCAQKYNFHWRAHSPTLPKQTVVTKKSLSDKQIKQIIERLGDDTSCTDVDAVILLATYGITPSEIARIRHNDIKPSPFCIFLRNKDNQRQHNVNLQAHADFLRYNLDGAINLCNMSKGYISRICGERLQAILAIEKISLQNLFKTKYHSQ